MPREGQPPDAKEEGRQVFNLMADFFSNLKYFLLKKCSLV